MRYAPAILAGRLVRALARLRSRGGGSAVPGLVVNRIAPGLLPLLPRAGYEAVSTFRDRGAAHPVAGLSQVNTHVDPIDWHGTKSLVDPAAVVAGIAGAVERRIAGDADRSEPVGLLTHHLVHDEAVWAFCEGLLAYLSARDHRFLRVDGLFHSVNRITVEL